MTSVFRLCSSSYRGYPSGNQPHAQYRINVSSPSTTNNEGGGWEATGPLGWESGISFSNFFELNRSEVRAVNRVLLADNYIYHLTGDRLWRVNYSKPEETSLDGFIGNPWQIVHTFTNQQTGRVGRNTGIYPCLIKTTQTGIMTNYIVGAYNSTVAGATTWKGFRYNTSTSGTEETSSTTLGIQANPALGGVKAEIFWNNQLYFIGDSFASIGVYNPSSHLVYTIPWGSGNTIGNDIWGPHDFCPYLNRLFVMNRGKNGAGGGSGIRIWDVTDNPARLVIDIKGNYGVTTATHTSEPVEGRCVLFTDRTYLYAGMVSAINSDGIFAYRLHRLTGDESGNLYYDGTNSNTFASSGTGRVNFFAEQNTYPDIAGNGYGYGAGQQMTLCYDTAGVTGITRQQVSWNGPSNNGVLEEGATGFVLHTLRETARAHNKSGGGERIFNPPSAGPRAEIINVVGAASGFLKFTYRIYNNAGDFPAGTPCAIQLRYSQSGHMPFEKATLRNPTVGTLKDLDTTIAIQSSDSGVNYIFYWDKRTDRVGTRFPSVALFTTTTGVP